MSTFKRILAEKTGRKDYGRKGGQGGTRSTSSTPYERRESRANMQDPSNTRSKRLGTDKPRVIKAPDGSLTITNMPEPSGSVTTDQVVDTADRRAKRGSSRGSGGGFGPSKDDAARYAGKPDTAQQAAAADDIRGRKGTDPTARKAASNVLGGGRKTPSGEELVGGETARSGRGQRYRQRRPSDVRASGISQARSSKQQAAYRQQVKREADKLLSALRSKRDISARMSRGIDDIERVKSLRSRAAQQVDLAKKTRARTAPGPQPSASQLTKFTTGQEKGYIGKSGAPTTKGIQTYTTRRATRGFGDAGYDAAKRGVKDPLGAAKSVDNIVSRAASGDKVARSEVKKTYKTMTSRYKDIVPSSQRTKAGLASLNKPVTAPPKVEVPTSTPAKPKVELPKTSSPSSGTGGSATTKTLEKTKTKPLELKLGTPTATSKVPTNASAAVPEKGFSDFTMRQMSGKSNQTYQYKQQKQPAPTEPPKAYQSTPTKSPDPKPTPKPTPTPKPAPAPAPDPAPAPTKQRRSLNATSKRSGTAPTSAKPTLTSAQQKKVTQRVLKTAKPQLGKRLAPKPKTVPNLAAKVNAQAATKTTLRGAIGRGLAGAAGAAFDVVQGREDAKKAGASDRRSWLRGAARAAGGLVGGTLGAIGGGGIGSAALGIGGYMAGSQAADKLFTSLAGATQKQKNWLRQKNLATQAGTRAKDVQYRKGNQAVVFDKRVGKERIGTWDPKSQTYKADVTNPVKAYTAKNPFERLGRQFSRSNEGSGLFGMGLVKGYGLADMAKRYYANKDEAARRKRVSDFKSTATR